MVSVWNGVVLGCRYDISKLVSTVGSCYIFVERGVDMTTINDIMKIITPIIYPSPVRRVILFGSYAKGTNTPDSDIDLVIDSNGKLKGIDFFALSSELVRALPIEADIFEMREINPASNMYDIISQEGIVIYDR